MSNNNNVNVVDAKALNVDTTPPEELTLLRYKIRELGEFLRIQKQKSRNWHTDKDVLNTIWKLLDMKSRDPQVSLNELWGTPQPLRRVRLRFRVVAANGTTVRMQNTFRYKTHLTAKEVVESITEYLQLQHERKPDLFPQWGFTKIELITRENNEKIYKSVTPQDDFLIPLVFPGPVLLHDWKLEFKVYLPSKPYHFITPSAYTNARLELVDCGTNLCHNEFEKTLNRTIHRAFSSGVSQIVCLSTNFETIRKNIEISSKRPNSLFCVVGVYPTEVAASLDPNIISQLDEVIRKHQNLIVGVGEIGLNLNENEKDVKEKESQLKCFEQQLLLASKHKLPVLIRDSRAHEHIVQLLSKHRPHLGNVIVNCFTGNEHQLQDFVRLDCFIVTTGFITDESRASSLRNVLKNVPSQRLLLATNAPYLIPFNIPPPFPLRNEPACLSWVLVAVAETLGVSLDHLAALTTENARKAFNLPTLVYNGTLTAKPQLIFEEVQKQEDDAVKAKEENTKTKTSIIEIELEPGQQVFEYRERKWIVSEKEKNFLEKQSKTQSPEGFLQIINDLDAKEIPKNAVVVGTQQQSKPEASQNPNRRGEIMREQSQGSRGRGRGRGRGREQLAKK